jgi:mannonate dehydratase
MKITGAQIVVTSPGRNFVTVRVETDEGLHGVGDATLNGRELAVASYLRDHLLPLVEGRDPFRIEDLWHEMYKGAYWRRGPVTMTAIGAIDTALWDIKAKALGVPVYELLGGAARERVMVYGHASGADADEVTEAAVRYVEAGYRAVRIQAGLPGMPELYGIGRGDLHYEPAERERLRTEIWDTSLYLHHIPSVLAQVRDAVGPAVHLLHDAHHRLRPIEAAQLGKALEPVRMFWLEDPVPAEVQESFRTIRNHTTTPIAVGEVFNTIYDAHTLIKDESIDYLRCTVSHAGGLTHLMRMAHLAELHHVRMACHGPTDLSPVNLAAALHFDLAVHNFGIQEYMRHTDETDRVFPHGYRFEDGHLHPGTQPGLGVDIDQALAAEHPYQAAYLPVARLQDGTVHSW